MGNSYFFQRAATVQQLAVCDLLLTPANAGLLYLLKASFRRPKQPRLQSAARLAKELLALETLKLRAPGGEGAVINGSVSWFILGLICWGFYQSPLLRLLFNSAYSL